MDGNVLKKEGSFAGDGSLKLSSTADRQKLLSVLRGTRMTRDEYNELRDLVRELAESGSTDKESALIEKLESVGVSAAASSPRAEEVSTPESVATAVVSPEPSTQSNVVKFGLTRPRPAFVSATPANPSPEPAAPTAEVQTPVMEEPVLDKEEAESVAETVPMSKTATQPEVPLPEEPKEVTQSIEYKNPSERIKEIKKEINGLVGNPINLIEKNSEVGRAYMNALLEAMKKANGGSAEEVNAAMTHLEDTYQAVKKVLDGQPVDIPKPTEVPKVEEKIIPEPAAAPIETEQVSEVSNEPEIVETTIPEPLQTGGEVIDDSHPESSDSIVSPFRPVASAPAVDVPQAEPVISEEPDAQAPVVPEVGLPKSDLYGTVETAEEPVVSAPEPAPASAVVKPLQSVATEKTQSNIDLASHREAAVAAEEVKAAEIAAMDPYERPEVTKGLEQLLSEWSLFKSSGIFGTGPHGLEHPLYKKLAGLQMSALVSGRFEDAKPEIRQSIADYMNGWRYEVGILYQHGETFEHYLRRVIRKILNKQQSKIEEAALFYRPQAHDSFISISSINRTNYLG